MTVKYAVETSDHREEIEEQIKAGVSAREISKQLSVKYQEEISNVSISAYINTLNTEEKVEEKTALEIIKALTARVRNLELNLWKYGFHEGQETGWGTYTIDGRLSHSLKRVDVLTDAMEVVPTEKEFKDHVAGIVKRRQEEDGLCLDPKAFDEERAAIAKKAEEDAAARKKALKEQKIAAAKAEIKRLEADRKTVLKNIEENAKNNQREKRLQALRDKALEDAAGIDENGDPLVD